MDVVLCNGVAEEEEEEKKRNLGEKDVILKKITTTDTKIYKRDKKMNL